MPAGRTEAIPPWGNMDALNKWFQQYTETPAGSLLLFLLVFVTRLALDRWQTRRELRRHHKRKGGAHG